MIPTRRLILAGLAALPLSLALSPAPLLATEGEPPTLETLPLVIHGEARRHAFTVEVARTIPERSRGLMERDHLDEEAGMLFLYRDAQSPRNGFWMYRTRIPLDIAFIGEDERIAAIRTMLPCASDQPSACPVTYPGVPYRAALEVNAGTFERLGIAEGDCVSWPGSAGHCLPAPAPAPAPAPEDPSLDDARPDEAGLDEGSASRPMG